MQGTQTQDPLAQLKDIHAPTEVSVWPLEWGWWLAIAILLIVLVILAIAAFRRYRFYQARREALASMQTINADQPDWPAKMNTLLKRTAISYFDSHRVASLHGMAWMAFLHSTLPQKHWQRYRDGLSTLSDVLYRKSSDTGDFNACQSACVGWIKHARLRSTPPPATTGSEVHHV